MDASRIVGVAAAAALFTAGLLSSGRPWSRRASDAIADMLFYLAVPALVFYKVYSVALDVLAEFSLVVVVSVLGALGTAALAVPRLLRGYPRETVGAAVLAAGIHNAAFLPIPLMTLLYGDAGPAALYSAVVNLITAVVVPVVVGIYSPRARGSAARRVAATLATYPPVYAIAAAALARGPGLPAAAEHVAHALYVAGSWATLASFYLVGETLAKAGLRVDKPVAVVAAWRLVVEPAIAVAAVSLAGLTGLWRAAALLEAPMPPATMNIVVSMVYGLDAGLVARAIGFVTPVSLAAVAAEYLLLPA